MTVVVNTDPDERVVLVDLNVQAVDREGRLDQYTDGAGLLVKVGECVVAELVEDLCTEYDDSLSFKGFCLGPVVLGLCTHRILIINLPATLIPVNWATCVTGLFRPHASAVSVLG